MHTAFLPTSPRRKPRWLAWAMRLVFWDLQSRVTRGIATSADYDRVRRIQDRGMR